MYSQKEKKKTEIDSIKFDAIQFDLTMGETHLVFGSISMFDRQREPKRFRYSKIVLQSLCKRFSLFHAKLLFDALLLLGSSVQ